MNFPNLQIFTENINIMPSLPYPIPITSPQAMRYVIGSFSQAAEAIDERNAQFAQDPYHAIEEKPKPEIVAASKARTNKPKI